MKLEQFENRTLLSGEDTTELRDSSDGDCSISVSDGWFVYTGALVVEAGTGGMVGATAAFTAYLAKNAYTAYGTDDFRKEFDMALSIGAAANGVFASFLAAFEMESLFQEWLTLIGMAVGFSVFVACLRHHQHQTPSGYQLAPQVG